MGWDYHDYVGQPTWFVAELVDYFREEQRQRRSQQRKNGKP